MSGISVRLVLFISGILSYSGGISHVMLLFWIKLEVISTMVIPCLGISLLLIYESSSISRTVLLELLPIPPRTRISLISERLFLGCLSSITLFYTPMLLQSGCPKHFKHFLKATHSVYDTCRSPSDGVVLCFNIYIGGATVAE